MSLMDLDRTTQPSREQLARIMDYTLLSPEATAADVGHLIDSAISLGVGAICVSPSLLHATEKATQAGLTVATVCGFPSGKHHVLVKAAEARLAVQFGASEIDMVVDIAAAQAGDSNALISEIATVREAVPHPVVLKVILESAVLSNDALATACRAALAAGADYVKTSTGFHPAGGASVEAVRVMNDAVRGQMGIKASGGIRTWDDAQALVAAGATRLGVSAAAKVLDGAPD